MAFIRWRGRCAQLLTTVYVDGRSKQITLTNIPGFYISEADKQLIEKKFPDVNVDWQAIARSLAEGPPGILKEKVPAEHLEMAVVEHHLRKWAAESQVANDARHLWAAAAVLTEWRARFYQTNENDLKPNSGKFQSRKTSSKAVPED